MQSRKRKIIQIIRVLLAVIKHLIINGYVRSKFELFCENKLKEHFPNLNFEFNSRKEIYYELDIYIPEIKLAIEINGPTHYFPIRRGEKNF